MSDNRPLSAHKCGKLKKLKSLKPNTMPTSMLSVKEAAEEKGVTVQAIHKAIQRGTLNAEKVGRYYVIHRDTSYRTYTPQSYTTNKN